MQADFYAHNRERLTDKINDTLIVLTAHSKMQGAADSAAVFQQEANFWYLTGIAYADWRLVIDPKRDLSWLIAPETDASHQVFDGSLDFDTAKAISGVDDVLDARAGEQLLRESARTYTDVYTLGTPPYAEYIDFMLNPASLSLREELNKQFALVKDCRKEIALLRAIKQPSEVEAIKQAAALSVDAFKLVKAKLSSYTYEYEAEAELAYHFRRHGAKHAFEPIVASGQNACTLHYIENDDTIRADSLLLIDAGASSGAYSADITRTFAVTDPNKRQQTVHAAVRAAGEEIIQLIRPGVSIKDYTVSADKIMRDAVLSLGLMKSEKDLASYRRYFPHAVSHGLGLDVHENLGGYKEFLPGMILTVEPGVYIPEESIGVRIEDDILITEQGNENLTASLSTDL